MGDFFDNCKVAWPLLAFILFWLLVSSTLLWTWEQPAPERLNSIVTSWPEALYLTWLSMSTLGNANPVTILGHLLQSADSLMGLVTIGTLVWLVTQSLTRTARQR